MVIIVTNRKSNRVDYICNILFNVILDTGCIVCREEDLRQLLGSYPTASVIFYLKNPQEKFGVGVVSMPMSDFMFQEKINDNDIKLIKPNLFLNPDFENNQFKNDYFLSSFILITEYEKYLTTSKDQYGRYPESNLITSQTEILANPYLHVISEYIYSILIDINPILQRGHHSYKELITMDVDRPFLYHGAKKKFVYSSLIKNFSIWKKEYVKASIDYLSNGIDPYSINNTDFNWIKENINNVFFLIKSVPLIDSNYPLLNDKHIELIKKFRKETKIKIGIHPSFNSYQDPTMLMNEKKKLEEIIQKEIRSSRMHFLKYSLPDTYQYLEMAGITDIYDGVCYSEVGFKYGIGLKFPWFNVVKNEISKLTVHPQLVMDRTLMSYLKVSQNESMTIIEDLKNISKKYGTVYSIGIHNDIFSNFGEWKDWRKILNINH